MSSEKSTYLVFEEKSVWGVLLKIAPPVMLAQLIQAMYNIVDSFFIGKYSGHGLTALSIMFPIQLILIAVSVGTGVGVNTLMSKYYAEGEEQKARFAGGTGVILALLSWLLFAVLGFLMMRPYVMTSAEAPEAIEYAVVYGQIICVGSFGLFLEGVWTKVHQAQGNMKLPMYAQVVGALTNIVLDPIFIFVFDLGVAGAAYATVIGQIIAAIITSPAFCRPPKATEVLSYATEIYKLGYPSILMQSLYTVYIIILNMILAGFCDEAVTVLGLYYKMQSFFYIPLFALQTCIVPYLSYTYTQKNYQRCQEIMKKTMILSLLFMLVGVACFEFIPAQMIGLFSKEELVLEIGVKAFRIIALCFLPAVFALVPPVFFQAIGRAVPSVFLSVTRQIFCLIPIFWALSMFGLGYTWWAFPLSEIITGLAAMILYVREVHSWERQEEYYEVVDISL